MFTTGICSWVLPDTTEMVVAWAVRTAGGCAGAGACETVAGNVWGALAAGAGAAASLAAGRLYPEAAGEAASWARNQVKGPPTTTDALSTHNE
jgi:hypothetical protein